MPLGASVIRITKSRRLLDASALSRIWRREGWARMMNVDLKQTSLALVGDLIAGTFLEVRSSKLRVRVSPHQGKQQIRYADMTT
jgi:hypothetical protein